MGQPGTLANLVVAFGELRWLYFGELNTAQEFENLVQLPKPVMASAQDTDHLFKNFYLLLSNKLIHNFVKK